MKKNTTHISSQKTSNVKEISDGVYINLNRITSDESDFEKAIEESFKELDENEIEDNIKTTPKESDASH